MKDWQVMVMREMIALDTKIIKLDHFLKKCTSLSDTDRVRLEEQHYHMGRYRFVLNERIEAWTQDETS